MIKLCQNTKKDLKPVQVNDFMTLLSCHKRGMPAYVKKGVDTIETKGGSAMFFNGVFRSPMALCEKWRSTSFDTIKKDFDWENPLIAPIQSIMKCESDKLTSYVAYNEEDMTKPINHFPLTGIQQLYEADPLRFV